MQSFKLQQQLQCPACQGKADGATNTGGHRPPANGDICVCFYCRSINQYSVEGNNVQLRVMTEEELFELRKTSPQTFATLMKIVSELNTCLHD